MVKAEVEDKKLGRHSNKKAKLLVCIESDFEGFAKKDEVEAHKRKIVPRQKQLKVSYFFYFFKNIFFLLFLVTCVLVFVYGDVSTLSVLFILFMSSVIIC